MDNGSWFWHLISRIFGACVLIAASAYLIKCAVGWLYQIRFALLVIAMLVVLIIVGIKVYHYRKSQAWQWGGDDNDENSL